MGLRDEMMKASAKGDVNRLSVLHDLYEIPLHTPSFRSLSPNYRTVSNYDLLYVALRHNRLSTAMWIADTYGLTSDNVSVSPETDNTRSVTTLLMLAGTHGDANLFEWLANRFRVSAANLTEEGMFKQTSAIWVMCYNNNISALAWAMAKFPHSSTPFWRAVRYLIEQHTDAHTRTLSAVLDAAVHIDTKPHADMLLAYAKDTQNYPALSLLHRYYRHK